MGDVLIRVAGETFQEAERDRVAHVAPTPVPRDCQLLWIDDQAVLRMKRLGACFDSSQCFRNLVHFANGRPERGCQIADHVVEIKNVAVFHGVLSRFEAASTREALPAVACSGVSDWRGALLSVSRQVSNAAPVSAHLLVLSLIFPSFIE